MTTEPTAVWNSSIVPMLPRTTMRALAVSAGIKPGR